MTKKISKASLYALVIAIAALFAASEAIAFFDNCELGDLTNQIGPYTVTLNSIELIDGTSNYRWNYTVVNTGTDTLTQLNFLAMLVPNCCGETVFVSEDAPSSPNIKYFGVAVGEDTLKFGQYNQGASVIKVVPNSATNWVIVTNLKTPTITPALIRYGTGKGIAVTGKVAGPGCAEAECPPPPPPQVRVEPRRQCYQFIAEPTPLCPEQQSSTWLAEWDGTDPCAVEVWAAYGNDVTCDTVKTVGTKLTGADLNTILDENGHNLSDYITNNSLCNEGWLRFVGADGCNQRCYVSGGKKYCF